MKIQLKLSLWFTFLSGTILMLFAGLVYYSAARNREIEFFKSLKTEATTKANLFFRAKVDSNTLQTIYKNNIETQNEVEVAIYTPDFQLLYHDADYIDAVKETESMISDILVKRSVSFYQDDWQVVGLLKHFNKKPYIITAIAYDTYGYKKVNKLRNTIFLVLVFAVAVIFISGRFFAKKALQPVATVVNRMKSITAYNLDSRLNPGKGKDEITALAKTFNDMLDRLEKSFDAQKSFVSNIAHEVRTPLSAIIAELDLATRKERSPEDYRTAIANALDDSRKLSRLMSSLLDFAKASYDPSEISFRELRLDELLLDAMHEVQKLHPEYYIDIHFEHETENDRELTVSANEYLLKVAFSNLIENGCKFSDSHRTVVSISASEGKVKLTFTDEGWGISAEDLPHIFEPFYRGRNNTFAEGNGIGLSLTEKILSLHGAGISADSTVGQGAVFVVTMKAVTGL